MERIVCLLAGYVFGLFQTGFIYGRMHGIDIRKYGSGNLGSTNWREAPTPCGFSAQRPGLRCLRGMC